MEGATHAMKIILELDSDRPRAALVELHKAAELMRGDIANEPQLMGSWPAPHAVIDNLRDLAFRALPVEPKS